MKYKENYNGFTVESEDRININNTGEIDIGGDNVYSPLKITIPGYTIHAWSSEWGGVTITPTES